MIIANKLNGHAIGIIMKEIVRRAINAIRQQQFIFESEIKEGYSGAMDDLVTSADRQAQEIYIRSLRECFPSFGIIAEEHNLKIPCLLKNHDIYFTVDPLDGTKAFGRRQSHGVGTMISLVMDHQVIAAYIGDVNTQEIYGYRPDTDNVWRISGYDRFERLEIDPDLPLSEQYLLLRDEPGKYSDLSRTIIGCRETCHQSGTGKKLFKSFEITSGSIGICMARLWKGEVGGVLLHAQHVTPWDETPLMGINSALGFIAIELDNCKNIIFRPKPVKKTIYRKSDVLIMHHSRILDFYSFIHKHK